MALLGAVVALACLLPDRSGPPPALPVRHFAALILLPALIAPVAAVRIDPGQLLVLVADFLMIQLAIIAPVIVLFCLTSGLTGRWVVLDPGAPAAGVAPGRGLAWSPGARFPPLVPGGGAAG